MTPSILLLLACNKPIDPAPMPSPTAPSSTTEPSMDKPVMKVAGQSRAAPSPAYAGRASAFALRTHKALIDPEKNSVMSGASAALAFSMLAAGGSEKTQADWEGVFGAELEAVHVDSARAMAAYNDTKGVELATANGVWFDGITPGEAFVTTLKETYLVTPGTLPFSADPAAAAAALDTWTSKHTFGMIEKLLPAADLSGVNMVLANALAFKGQWAMKFDPALTADLPFQAPGGTIQVPTMSHTKLKAGFTETETYTAAALPYEGGGTKMLVIVPADGQTLASLEATLTPELITSLATASERDTHVKLPRFSIETEHDLVAKAKALGIEGALVNGDYSGIASGQRVDKAIQKVVIEVDEEGTQAAAVTAIATKRGISRPAVLNADRPFVFMIWHTETQSPLFTGHVVDPR